MQACVASRRRARRATDTSLPARTPWRQCDHAPASHPRSARGQACRCSVDFPRVDDLDPLPVPAPLDYRLFPGAEQRSQIVAVGLDSVARRVGALGAGRYILVSPDLESSESPKV